jgi:hypothetical protein
MFCPQCGSQQSNETRFCKSCGANLQAVLQAAATREADEKFDWGKTWVAEMFLSEGERKRREEEIERQRGITPEVKRYNEIKAGVITGCVGLGAMVFLFVLMQGIILSGDVTPGDAQILSRLWVVGVIPFLIGLALIFTGLFVSKKIVELTRRESPEGPGALPGGAGPRSLRPADTSEFIPSNFSVTEEATKQLRNSPREPPAPHNF